MPQGYWTCTPGARPEWHDCPAMTTNGALPLASEHDLARHRRCRLHRRARRARPARGRPGARRARRPLDGPRATSCPSGVPFVRGSILDGDLLVRTLERHRVDGRHPRRGLQVRGRLGHAAPAHLPSRTSRARRRLLAAMQEQRVDRIVFSSSAAVYGTPDVDLVTEETPKNPQSPYGESKLIGEWLLRDQAVARRPAAHLAALLQRRRLRRPRRSTTRARTTSSRSSSTALLEGRTPRINGDDYPTPDGTNVRDYIHVADLALAHVGGRAAPRGRRAARARLQPRQRRRASRSARS